MRRMIVVVATGLLSVALAAGAAQAAPMTKSTTNNPAKVRASEKKTSEWFAIAGERRSESSAKELLMRLEKKGFHGYTIRTRREHRGAVHHVEHEVERMFPDRRAAEQETTRLHDAGFRGWVAYQRA
jgi:cell division septation protein DedD